MFYCWQIFSRSLSDCLYTAVNNNRSRKMGTLSLHKSLRQQHMRKLTRRSLMLSTVTSKGLRESTIFTPMPFLSPLKTNTKTLALWYIPNYNAGTDVHAVATFCIFVFSSEQKRDLDRLIYVIILQTRKILSRFLLTICNAFSHTLLLLISRHRANKRE